MAQALSFAFTATPVPALTAYVLECTAQQSPGVSFVPRSRYRQIAVIAAAAASPYSAIGAYQAKFGALISGKKIFYRLTAITSDGQRSPILQSSVIVT